MNATPKKNGPEALERLPSRGSHPNGVGNMNAHDDSMAARIAEAVTIFDMIEVGESIRAEYIAACDGTGNNEEAADALCVDMATINNLIAAFPVQVIGEATAKARYLLATFESEADPLSFDCLMAVLHSLDRDPEAPLDRLSRAAFEYREAAQELEPDATEWEHGRAEDDHHIRFRLEGRRPLTDRERSPLKYLLADATTAGIEVTA